MDISQYKNKKILIMGLGINGGGTGAAEFFARAGARVTVTDLKTKQKLAPSLKVLKKYKNIRYVLGWHRKGDFQKADLIIKNPDVRNTSPYLALAKKHSIPIETDVSIFFQVCKNPIIGVTGTKGKSTTTHFLRSVLETKYRVHVGGNIGISVFRILPKLKSSDLVLLELSSWQLEGIAHIMKSPHIAVITNIQQDHLNTYKNFKEYEQAKKYIYAYQKKYDWLIVPPELKKATSSAPGQRLVVSQKSLFEKKLRRAGFRFAGKHNVQNAAMAVTVGTILTVPEEKAINALANVKPLFGRYETVAIKKGIMWINDTCSTAPYSTIQSINEARRPILITGGTDKDLWYNDLARAINLHVKKLILLSGSATEKLKKGLTVPFFETRRMPDAVKYAALYAKRGDRVLFSPGAASFELFKNEFDRGKKFVAHVKRLKLK